MILKICTPLVYLIVLQEWVPIIRCDMMTQRKMKAQPPLSDAYLHGMPAKRRKVIRSALTSLLTLRVPPAFSSLSCVYMCSQTGQGSGSLLSISDAVSQAARTAGVKPMTSAERLQDDLETRDLKEAYAEQVPNRRTNDITKADFLLRSSLCFQRLAHNTGRHRSL